MSSRFDRFARLVGNGLAAAGLAGILVGAAHVTSGIRAQRRAGEALRRRDASAQRLPAPASPRQPGEALGWIELPRIGLRAIVFEGATPSVLREGPGHLPSSVWPDDAAAPGNCVIAGHRDSFFRSLREAREGDLVVLTGAAGVSAYRLAERRIVNPGDLAAVAPTADSRLTLITCYPFRWIGAAPRRLVWTATPTRGPGGPEPPSARAAGQATLRPEARLTMSTTSAATSSR